MLIQHPLKKPSSIPNYFFVGFSLSSYVKSHLHFMRKVFHLPSSLTITFSILLGIGVVEHPLPIMGPCHTAELDSLEDIWKLFGTINFHELDCHPVWAAGTQTIGKIFPIFTEGIACGTQEKFSHSAHGDTIPSFACCPPCCLTCSLPDVWWRQQEACPEDLWGLRPGHTGIRFKSLDKCSGS